MVGSTSAGAVRGTMVHGSLEDDGTRSRFLADALGVTSQASFPEARERRLDLLAELVEEHLDVDALLDLATHGAPRACPCCLRGTGDEGAASSAARPRRGRSPQARVAAAIDVLSSLAGRVARPRLPVGSVRIGGFGGVDGLRACAADYDAVVDATHPFSAADLGQRRGRVPDSDVPLLRLERPGWADPARRGLGRLARGRGRGRRPAR